jgi:uncharacterized membrane protein (DUF4010 family)
VIDVASRDVLYILVATFGGAVVGLERQWSGHASGPNARFAGVRTFTLIGGLSGIAGWLCASALMPVALVLLGGLMGLIVAAYARASARDVDGTTEMAAIVTSGAGVLAGLGHLALASGIVALTSLLLVEKPRLHAWVSRIDEPEMRAGVRFAVMAIVVLPLLPEGPFGPWGGVRPRALWALVLFFSGLSFVGYVARRMAGPRQGYAVAGLLGGLVSSTNVTITFARLSRDARAPRAALAAGVLAACALLFVRVEITSAVLSQALSRRLIPVFVPAFVIGVVGFVLGLRQREGEGADREGPGNPLEFRSAIQMTALFQAVLFLIHFVQSRFGASGVVVTGALVGLTDMDALTLSMSRQAAAGTDLDVAALALATGIVSNTIVKLLISVIVGRGLFRTLVGIGLAAIAAALVTTMLVLLR